MRGKAIVIGVEAFALLCGLVLWHWGMIAWYIAPLFLLIAPLLVVVMVLVSLAIATSKGQNPFQ